jgi:hypothetical protein
MELFAKLFSSLLVLYTAASTGIQRPAAGGRWCFCQ